MALDIDPERDARPFSEEVVSAYNRDPKWSAVMETKFRTFIENKDQRALQFPPMRAPLREFLHLLAEAYGLDSESQDPEPYRSVMVRKPSSFVVVPRKALAECAAKTGAASGSAPAGVQQLKKIARSQAVNAFLLKGIKVGLLATELEKELSILKDSQLRFDISWCGDEDVLLKPRTSSLAIDQVEAELHGLSTKLKRVVAARGIADAAELCWVGQDGRINSRDGSGWSVPNSRKSAPVATWSTKSSLASKNGFELFGGAGGSSAAGTSGNTAKKDKSKEVERPKEVVDDWEVEAEELEQERK